MGGQECKGKRIRSFHPSQALGKHSGRTSVLCGRDPDFMRILSAWPDRSDAAALRFAINGILSPTFGRNA
jgi:hypothetical protein